MKYQIISQTHTVNPFTASGKYTSHLFSFHFYIVKFVVSRNIACIVSAILSF